MLAALVKAAYHSAGQASASVGQAAAEYGPVAATVVQLYGPQLPALGDRVYQYAQEGSRQVQQASQGGNTADPGGPKRPFRDLAEELQYRTCRTRYGEETRLEISVRGANTTVDVDGIVEGLLHEAKHLDAGNPFYTKQIGTLGTGLELRVRQWGGDLQRLSLAAQQHGYKGVKVFVDWEEAIRVAKESFGEESWFQWIELIPQTVG